MSMTKEKLDHIAQTYHTSEDVPDKHIEDMLQEYSARWILEQLAGVDSVLELGFGEGIITEVLVKEGKTITLIEGSGILVDEVRRRWAGKLTCEHVLFEEYTPAKPFDAVLASHVLEHVDEPVPLLKRIRTWLAPAGKLLIIVPNRESLHRQLAVLMGLAPTLDTLGPRDLLVGHQRVYSHVTLEEDLIAAGFKVAQASGYFLKPLPNNMMLDFSEELLNAMNEISPNLPKELLANITVMALPV